MDRDLFDADEAHSIEAVAKAAETLARKHDEIEDRLTRIFFGFSDDSDPSMTRGAPIKLLEVNHDMPEAGIMPLHFGPAPASGILFAPVII